MSHELTGVIHQAVPILGQMGIDVVESERGRAIVVLPFAPNRNHVGTAYAGSLFSAAEVLGGILALSSLSLDGYAPVIRSMSIDYRRPGLGEMRASAELADEEIDRICAEALANGKANYDLTATIVDAEGAVLATTLGHYQLRRFG